MALHLETGKKGEALAVKSLASKGYIILETNFKTRFCELDIIARINNIICFVEVKTRTGIQKGLPREAVDRKKQAKIITGAQAYIKQHHIISTRVRFDVIEIILDQKNATQPSITHIENAFIGV